MLVRGRSRPCRSSSSTPAGSSPRRSTTATQLTDAPRPDRRPHRPRPIPAGSPRKDPHRALWMTNPDLCCHIRKTEPLQRALTGFDAWFTGRKRFQNAAARRAAAVRGRRRAHQGQSAGRAGRPTTSTPMRPLHDLPEHPLVAKGYPSIGCVPCTTRVAAGRGPARRPLARPRQDRVRHPRAARDRRQRHLRRAVVTLPRLSCGDCRRCHTPPPLIPAKAGTQVASADIARVRVPDVS